MADYTTTYGPTAAYGNRQDRQSITTSMLSLWDESGHQLRVACLDNGLSVGIWVPMFSPDGRRQYPVEQRYSTVLQPKIVKALSDAIKTRIISAYEQGRNDRCAVYTNAARSSMTEIELVDGTFFVNIYRNCDPMTHVPQHTVKFKFDPYYIVTKFNPDTGESEVEPVQADFFIFFKALEAYTDLAMGMVAAHAVRTTNTNTMMARIMEYVRAIAETVHAQLPAPVSGYQIMQPSPQANSVPTQNPLIGMYGKPEAIQNLTQQPPVPQVTTAPPEAPAPAEVQEVGAITDLL